MMSIDYIVLTWNSASTLELALSSIRNYGHPNRIIVVDKHSTDRTTAIAGKYGCKVILSGAGAVLAIPGGKPCPGVPPDATYRRVRKTIGTLLRL